jgi:hypothetical protein
MPILSKKSKTRTTNIAPWALISVVLVFDFFDKMGIYLPVLWVLWKQDLDDSVLFATTYNLTLIVGS